ncbi:TonB family protein [Hoeflea sp. YIM 152468]|uniref:energy transducer TonB family protein n=1 Tax=Hoeflea sp. YIM 152468 TaxID=3031759 RepID=UPI0023DCB210|nr:TonB family protein [Hoeflea sp. YIM 152468]MDF1609093.1 TonB family protein [Hoeflea sp. YIM 152468]
MTGMSKLRLAALLALSGSAILHVAAMAIAPSRQAPVQIEGSQATEMAALGSSFADLVRAGDRFEPAVPVEHSRLVEAQQPPLETATGSVPPLQPSVTVAASSPVTALAAAPASPAPGLPVPLTKNPEAALPALIRPVTPKSVPPASTPVKPVQAADEPDKLSPAKAARTIEPIQAPAPEPGLQRIPKPKPKPVRKPARNKPDTGQKVANAKIDSKAGSHEGRASAKAAPGGKARSTSKTGATGNAAAANYPGKVYARIARTRQTNSGGRGVAYVRFKVASSGKASSVSVSRSSGNSRVDRAAIAHIKRASPFPKPPAGAQTSFVIPVEFRR